jgi:hypothetical protein
MKQYKISKSDEHEEKVNNLELKSIPSHRRITESIPNGWANEIYMKEGQIFDVVVLKNITTSIREFQALNSLQKLTNPLQNLLMTAQSTEKVYNINVILYLSCSK